MYSSLVRAAVVCGMKKKRKKRLGLPAAAVPRFSRRVLFDDDSRSSCFSFGFRGVYLLNSLVRNRWSGRIIKGRHR